MSTVADLITTERAGDSRDKVKNRGKCPDRPGVRYDRPHAANRDDGGTMTEKELAPAGIDPNVPSVARMYDYYLGGKDNFASDRAAAEKVMALVPTVLPSGYVVANRRPPVSYSL